MPPAQVESETGGKFAQVGETGYPKNPKVEVGLMPLARDQNLEQDRHRSYRFFETAWARGHKDGHDGQFSRDFQSLSVALTC
jgi:hypothetical protein